MNFVEKLIDGENAEKEFKYRSSEYLNIVSIKKEDVNLFLREHPNYEIIKENPKKYSLGIKKDKGEIFENKVWCLFYKMGFKKFNSGRKFDISFANFDGCQQQIDVFCADDETALIIECKSGYDSTSLKENVQSYAGIIKGIRNTIHKELGKNMNIAFIYATESYNFSELDENRLNMIEGPHYHFDEKMINNFYQLVNQIGSAAKYQLLGLLFKNNKIKKFDNRVPAIEGKMGGVTYYSFVMKPSQLLKMAYVLHRNNINSSEEMMPSYQRIIKKDRLVKIREFINNNGYFPNSIIVSIRTDNPDDKKLNFEYASSQDADKLARVGTLILPQKYQTAYVIDGQHRLYGYSDTKYESTNSIPVIAFVNMKKEAQVQMFMDINENQKSVPKVLRDTLEADLLYEAKDYSLITKSIKKRIAMKLGESNKSAIKGLIQTGENPGGTVSPLSIDTIFKALNKTSFFNAYDKNNVVKDNGYFDFGCKTPEDKIETEEYIFELINWVLKKIKNYLDDKWNVENGFVITNNLLHAIICIINDSINLKIKNREINVFHPNINLVKSVIIEYVELLCRILGTFDASINEEFRALRGEPGLKESWFKLGSKMYHYDSSFNPEWMTAYIEQYCQENKEQAQEILTNILYAITSNVRCELKNIDDKNWSLSLIPSNTLITLNQLLIAKQKEFYKNGQNYNGDILDVASFAELSKICHYTYTSNWSKFGKKIFNNPNPNELFEQYENNKDLSIIFDLLYKRVMNGKDLPKRDFDDLLKCKSIYLDEKDDVLELIDCE